MSIRCACYQSFENSCHHAFHVQSMIDLGEDKEQHHSVCSRCGGKLPHPLDPETFEGRAWFFNDKVYSVLCAKCWRFLEERLKQPL